MASPERHSDKYYGTHPSFKTRWRHRKLGYFLHRNRARPEGVRTAPEMVAFDPEPGCVPEEKPPVRIFLDTEPNQFRAERIFVWSILQARNPARRYEIYFMKDLAGFDRRGWKTGFTNYRYAIPALAGNKGRAIYNDVDQIYLGDPAELFDRDMEGKGILGINERETSVMLIDCGVMADVWPLFEAQHGGKHKYFRAQMHDNGLWGAMPGAWNARDWEYQEGSSKLLHYTTLQTQPWQPFPKELKYEESPEGRIWFDMEEAADRAGFTIFTEDRPSNRYGEALLSWRDLRGQQAAAFDLAVNEILGSKSDGSRLDFGASGLPNCDEALDLGANAKLTANRFGQVVIANLLSHMPSEDVPWLLDKAFRHAVDGHILVIATSGATSANPMADAGAQEADWWRGQMQAAAKRINGVSWTLSLHSPGQAAGKGQITKG